MSTVAASLFLFPCPQAVAGDYSVKYAIDAGGKNDAGKIESCEYFHECMITSKELGLTIFLHFARENHEWVELQVYGPPGCCYSVDAARSIYLEIKPTLQRVLIYEGRLRRRNEFVLNQLFGVLYVEFSNLR